MKEKKGFLKELEDRNVWQEIKAYIFGGATLIPLVYLLQELDLIDINITKSILILFFSLFPSVFFFAYNNNPSKKTNWSTALKLFFPINLIMAIFLVFIFYNNTVEATEFEKVTIVNPLTQEIEEREIVKPEYRKRLQVCFFENTSQDTTLDWLQYGLMEACHTDLEQEDYITNWNRYWLNIEQEGYKYGEKVALTTYIDMAKRKNINYILQGEFKKENEYYIITTYLWNVNTVKTIAKHNFKGTNLFSLIDSISYKVKIDLLDKKYVENSIDMPVSSILTESILAFKYYINSLEENYKDQLNTREEIALLHKCLKEDPKFVYALQYCKLKYEFIDEVDSVNIYYEKVMDNITSIPEKEQYSIKYGYLKHIEKHEEADLLLDSWVKLYPNQEEPHFFLLSKYRKNKMYEKIIDECKILIQIDSIKHYRYMLDISNIYIEIFNDYNKGLVWFKRYIHMEADKYEANTDLAQFFNNIHEIDSAKYYYKKALVVKPRNIGTHYKLITLDIQESGDYKSAKNRFNNLLKFCKNRNDSLRTIGYNEYFLEKRGLFNDAEALNDSIEKIANNYDWLSENKELLKIIEKLEGFYRLLERGKTKEAAEIVRTISNYAKENKKEKSGWTLAIIDMWYSGSINRFCMHENTREEYTDIIEDFIMYQKEKSNNDKSISIWFGSYTSTMLTTLEAKLLFLNNKYNEAIELLEKHKTIASGPKYILQLARYYQEVGNYKKSEEHFKLLLKRYPYNPKYNYYAALLYHDWKKQEKAEEHLKITLNIWEDADEDYIFSNMANATAQEWGMINTP